MQNLEKNWLVVSKLIRGIWQILTRALRSLKDSHFNGLFLTKVYNVWANKVQRSYFSWHWRVMQILKKNLWFGKRHEEFGKFSPEHSKDSILGLWLDPFIQSRKCMSLKFAEELCVMTIKNDAKFGEELTCSFKIDTRNLTNFVPSTRKSQKSPL